MADFRGACCRMPMHMHRVIFVLTVLMPLGLGLGDMLTQATARSTADHPTGHTGEMKSPYIGNVGNVTSADANHSTVGDHLRANCLSAVSRARLLRRWVLGRGSSKEDWGALSRVQDLFKVTCSGSTPLKNWLLHFWGGKQHGGVDVAYKIRSFWAPRSAGLLGGREADRVTLTASSPSGFCAERCVRVGGLMPKLTEYEWWTNSTERVHAMRLLFEVFSYHVEKVLGFNTVPPGRLVAISTPTWAKHFSEFFCSNPQRHQAHMQAHVDSVSTASDPMILIGWMTGVVHPLVKNPSPLVELGCLDNKIHEPSKSYAEYGPTFLNSYYEAMLSGAIASRYDQIGNCFATRANRNTPDLCDDAGLQELQRDAETSVVLDNTNAAVKQTQPWHSNMRVVNLDNDKPDIQSLKSQAFVLQKPCDVPRHLRDAVTRVAGNFSAVLLASIRDAEPLLVEADYKELVKYSKVIGRAEQRVIDLATQFRSCVH